MKKKKCLKNYKNTPLKKHEVCSVLVRLGQLKNPETKRVPLTVLEVRPGRVLVPDILVFIRVIFGSGRECIVRVLVRIRPTELKVHKNPVEVNTYRSVLSPGPIPKTSSVPGSSSHITPVPAWLWSSTSSPPEPAPGHLRRVLNHNPVPLRPVRVST